MAASTSPAPARAPLTPADLVAAFRQCGLKAGDLLMLHADALVLAQLPPMSTAQRYDTLFAALDEVLGPSGTLVVPTFTYSFTKGEAFDVAASPSTVGALTEHFRTLPGVRRSRDPIFSVAVRGALADAFAAAPVGDCFGPDSVFGLLDRHQGWIACLGCSLDRVTHTHYVEQSVAVDYRYFKDFSGRLIDADQTAQDATVRYFVRDVDRQTDIDLSRLRARLSDRGLLTSAPVGRVALIAVPCRAFAAEAQALIAEHPSALIAEGATSTAGGSAA